MPAETSAEPTLRDTFELDVRNADINAAKADELDLQGAAAIVSDPDARSGSAFRFRRSGDELSWPLANAAPGTYRIKVSARADLYKGAPELTLKLGSERKRKAFKSERYTSLEYGTFELGKSQ